jgi:hypothetical protein
MAFMKLVKCRQILPVADNRQQSDRRHRGADEIVIGTTTWIFLETYFCLQMPRPSFCRGPGGSGTCRL